MIAFLIYLLCIQITNAYVPTEHILLNCGEALKLNSSDGQSWDGDAGTKLSPYISMPNLSSPATTGKTNSSHYRSVPYLTARIFHSKFSYIFPLSPGQKILRFYFYPATYTTTGSSATQSFDKTQSLFGVTANQYTLLTNFSASLTLSSLEPKADFFVKEFIFCVGQSKVINVSFWPSTNSYAFINGIEVVSIPANFYLGHHDNYNPPTYVNFPSTPYELEQNYTALETLYRLNVGGQKVTREGDTGMFREWLQDDYFLTGDGTGNPLSNASQSLTWNPALQTPNYSAPAIVYQTARAMGMMANQTPPVDLTWRFQVDSGFYYMLRLHFCEFMPDVVGGIEQRVFNILINNVTAEINADIIYWTVNVGTPIFTDYVVFVRNPPAGQIKQDLFLALHPSQDIRPNYLDGDALLNGLEIFKLNTTGGSLAVVKARAKLNTTNIPTQQLKGGKVRFRIMAKVVAGGATAVLLVLSLLVIIQRRRRLKGIDRKITAWNPLSTKSGSTETSTGTASSSLPLSGLCRQFLIEEIRSATRNFDPALVIGMGGFGNVYRGYIDGGLSVAIKRSNPDSSQGANEFRTEIQMLSNLRHLHLVSLIGYCNDDEEMILVYDYMPNGTLRDHLYWTENPPLTWNQRLEICISAARGLHYLHSEANPIIVHRDVKSNNILLDENWVAKISDFGLSKMGAPDESFILISTNVKGTFGYLDPEYFLTKKLTRKSDVYAFGVVLFEVLSGRAAVDMQLPDEQHSLANWARSCIKNGQVDELIDRTLEGQITPASLRLFVGVSGRCLDTHSSERPAMADIVLNLETALALQQNPSSAQQADEVEL